MSDPAISPGLQRQLSIYEAGLKGSTPALPIDFQRLEEQAKKKMKERAFDYVAGGAGSEDTVRDNRAAFQRWRIVPRLLRPIASRNLTTTLFGQSLPAPILFAPVGVLKIVHGDAELAVARVAKKLNLPLILSTASSFPLETVAKEMETATRWFQLYWPANQELAVSFVRRAELAGYSALVVTLDTSLLAWRERDLQNAYLPFMHGDGLANYFTDPVFQKLLGGDPRTSPVQAIQLFGRLFANPSLTWEQMRWLRSMTKLPILLKGLLHPDDARQAVDHGINGIVVSNHGGRQLDGAIATLDALPGIVAAVKDQATVLLDSGVRRGADIIKALALGARAVLIGRPYCYGLALGGEEGVCEVVQNLIADLDLTLGLTGCAALAELRPELLVKAH
jgi:isopentenyl diphosphate isomerase/L-lactate dehydrogenase-like FMN-dependent dehydrogenase